MKKDIYIPINYTFRFNLNQFDMIYPTPVQSDLVTKSNWPTIRQEFHEYETTFVLLHPFLKIKKDCEIKFEPGNWPSKKEILDCTVALSWN